MKSLIIIPHKNTIDYFLLSGNAKKELYSSSINNFRNQSIKNCVASIFKCLKSPELFPDFIVLKVQYGGMLFNQAELVNYDILKRLKSLAAEAPLHIPPVIELVTEFLKNRKSIPLVLVFETAFFTKLPEREACYAISSALTSKMHLRRFGFHGIFHQAAVEMSEHNGAKKLISICLEPRPEITAVIDGCPVLSTSGSTPLEGLPGEKSSGEIDPFIIIALNKKLDYGPEQINRILSENSGISGLIGKNITFPELFASKNPEIKRIKDFFQYRVLLACGSCIAAMGGVDLIVFSGRYHSIGENLQKFIRNKLFASKMTIAKFYICQDRLPVLLSDFAESIIISESVRKSR